MPDNWEPLRKEHFRVYHAKVQRYLRNKEIFGSQSEFMTVEGEE